MSDLETHTAAAAPPAPQPPASADERPVGLGALYRALWEHAAGARPHHTYIADSLHAFSAGLNQLFAFRAQKKPPKP